MPLALRSLLCIAMLASASASGGSLKLELSAAKSRILIGEPLRTVMTWSTTQPAWVATDAVLWINDGGGFVEHRETRWSTASALIVPQPLKPGDLLTAVQVVAVSGGRHCGDRLCDVRFAFPHAGRYELRARQGRLASNVLPIEVAAPEGHDREFFERHLSRRPDLLTSWPIAVDAEAVRRLCRQHGEGPYLDWIRLELAHHDLAVAPHDREGVEAAVRRLLTEPAAGAFEEERLRSMMELAGEVGLPDLAREMERRLRVRIHRRSAAARRGAKR